MDVDLLTVRITALLEKEQLFKEREVGDVMALADQFPQLYDDEPLKRAIEVFSKILFEHTEIDGFIYRDPIILVFDRQNHFRGLIAMRNLLKVMPPLPLRYSTYATHLTGMFLGQCMLLDNKRVEEVLDESYAIDINAPLMEAVRLILFSDRSALPVFKNSQLSGVIREQELIAEICRIAII